MIIIKNPKKKDFKVGDIIKWEHPREQESVYYWKILKITEDGLEGTDTYTEIEDAQKDNKMDESEHIINFDDDWLREIYREAPSSLKDLISR